MRGSKGEQGRPPTECTDLVGVVPCADPDGEHITTGQITDLSGIGHKGTPLRRNKKRVSGVNTYNFRPRIGVLALQGDFEAHIKMLATLGIEGIAIRLPRQLEQIDGIIIPGGES